MRLTIRCSSAFHTATSRAPMASATCAAAADDHVATSSSACAEEATSSASFSCSSASWRAKYCTAA